MSSALAQRRQSPSEKEKMRGKRSFSSSLPGSVLFGASSRSKEKDGRGKVADPIVQLGDSSQHTTDFPSTTPPRSTSPIPERLYPRRSVRHSLPSVSVTMSDSALVSPPLSTGSTTSRRSTPSQLKSSLMSHLNRHSIAVPPVGFPSVEGLPFPAELKKQKSASSITFIPDDENKLTTRPRKLSQQSYSSSNSSSSQKGMWIPHFRKGEATVSGISAVGEGSSVLWRTVSEPAKPVQDVTANQLLASLSEGPIAGVEVTKTLSTLAESPLMELDEPIAGQLDRHPLVNGADYDSDLASSPQPLSPLQRPTSPPPIIPPTPPRASSPPRTILKDSSSPVRPRPQSRRSVSFSLPAAIVIKPTVVASVEVELDDDDRKVRGSDIDTESEEGKTPTGMHFADADDEREDEILETPRTGTFSVEASVGFSEHSSEGELARRILVISLPHTGISLPIPFPYFTLPVVRSVRYFVPPVNGYLGLAVVDKRHPERLAVRPLEQGEEDEFGNVWRDLNEKGLLRVVMIEIPIILITSAWMWMRWARRK